MAEPILEFTAVDLTRRTFEGMKASAKEVASVYQVFYKGLEDGWKKSGLSADQFVKKNLVDLNKLVDDARAKARAYHDQLDRGSGVAGRYSSELTSMMARYASIATIIETARRAFMEYAQQQDRTIVAQNRMNLSTEQRVNLEHQFRNTARETGIAMGQWIDAAERMYNAGMKFEDVTKVLPELGKAIHGQGEELGNAAEVVTRVIQTMGLQATDATFVWDQISKATSKYGLDLQQLSRVLPQATSAWREYGTHSKESLAQMLALLSVARNEFRNTTFETFAFTRAMENMVTEGLAKAIGWPQRVLRQELDAVQRAGGDVIGYYVQMVDEAVRKHIASFGGTYKTAMEEIFPEDLQRRMVRAWAQHAYEIGSITKDVYQSMGEGAAGYARRHEDAMSSWDRLKQALAETMRLLGELQNSAVGFEHLKEIIEGINELLERMNQMETPAWIKALTLIPETTIRGMEKVLDYLNPTGAEGFSVRSRFGGLPAGPGGSPALNAAQKLEEERDKMRKRLEEMAIEKRRELNLQGGNTVSGGSGEERKDKGGMLDDIINEMGSRSRFPVDEISSTSRLSLDEERSMRTSLTNIEHILEDIRSGIGADGGGGYPAGQARRGILEGPAGRGRGGVGGEAGRGEGGVGRPGRYPMGERAARGAGAEPPPGPGAETSPTQRGRIAQAKAALKDQLRREGVPEENLEEASNLLAGQALAESGMDPNAQHDIDPRTGQPTGYGIYGARGSRRVAMLNWMREHGYAPNSLEGQARYMAHEAMTGRGYERTRRALMTARPETRAQSTDIITREFEAPRVINPRVGHVGRAAAIPAGPQREASLGPPGTAGTEETGTPSGGGRAVAGRDLGGVDPRLVEIAKAGAAYLPEGYTIRPTSGVRAGGRGYHPRGQASDWQIYDAEGRPIPNRGEDTTGMYQRWAQGSYRYQLERYPELTGQWNWGGAHGTSYRNPWEPDLMHQDLGGVRGRISRYRIDRLGPAERLKTQAAHGIPAPQDFGAEPRRTTGAIPPVQDFGAELPRNLEPARQRIEFDLDQRSLAAARGSAARAVMQEAMYGDYFDTGSAFT